MSKYFIYEGNLEKLDAKMQRIKNKCAKYNVDFKYEKTGVEELREVEGEDGLKISTKFVEIEVEGFLKHQNWNFIAKIDHTENGNIIRQFDENIEVPTSYRHTDCICEHCNSHRIRKFTYLVHNTETDEWKQVGSTCLKEFTMGLDADAVASFISFYDYVIEGEKGCYNGVAYDPEYPIKDYLMYVKETVDRFGYLSKNDAYENYCYYGGETRPTSSRAFSYFMVGWGRDKMIRKDIIKEMSEIDLTDDIARRPENKEYVESAIEWIRNLEVKETEAFMYNLKLIFKSETFPIRNLGYVAALMPCYYRHLKDLAYEKKVKEQQEIDAKSEFQGEIKSKITFQTTSCTKVYTYETVYGVSHIYKFTDENGNVYTWTTGKDIECDEDKVYTVTGTVKDHQVYKGIKQTVLTRCKVA